MRNLRPLATIGALSVAMIAMTGCASDSGGGSGSAEAGDDKLVIASWGGAFTEATRTNLAEPFQEETGIQVEIIDVPGTQVTQMQQMVDADDVQWDIMDSLGAADAFYMYQEGLIQELPAELSTSLTETLGEEKMSEFGFTFANLGYVIACNNASGQECPDSLEGFFDPAAFPGNREIPGEYYSQLAAALVAASGQDTMSEDIDLGAALAQLEQVEPATTVWYTSGDQQEQVLRQGEADFGLIYSGRAYNLVDEGLDITVNWSGVYDPGYTAIATGAPNQAAAEQFMQWVAENPEAQAGFAEDMSYGVPNAEALEVMPQEAAERLADYPANFEQLVQQNFTWYLANKEAVDTGIRNVVQGG
ncbi:extracellular solute-binding protein [Agromyces aerolatus]|uniref:extracellular solute-binding protein n=1 Tax=Agromyces sp. LY-1074 TaxID=3074080 RepID=UPI00285B95EB|nr:MULTISPECIES: extracellular solute-binding protein [unclassified Agromyces]MDR5701913.1 extracellular solute-binding protein [Agromyces sp. LY-1074]MDR5708119.1 extracellular solute-binding protein [Agromyces sp. LY-1358]